jgi:polyisoprenoid-binding protein YceI
MSSLEDLMSAPTTPNAAPFRVTGDYTLDPDHTRFAFAARHAMVTKVRGHFAEFSGMVHLDADDPSLSTAQVTIKTASVDTGSDSRDEHLRTNDFLDMDKYPKITFSSTEVRQVDDEHFALTGDLTIKATTRQVTITFQLTGASVDRFGAQRLGFEGSLAVNRKDWGVSWNAPLEAGGMLVSERVTLDIDVAAIKQQMAA